ncbi:hypothetical protein VOLCADRAFT_120959 [Volvox carteri f. nagariensis]|uniref:YdbS-like PH domain-containing protein n=1 Tax=Volvox carteri f. nagariensis TaxID=3068 RepID=D8TY45_VOLCA|nr:uncharacterized protein VOLCADRAFT_120959 [Volvox carteri f. nagariensis]EFJ47485.1 hypothetical protein VOLCADRAFT_120959 [Volvox carteri f. nagariensis]|eukprot:XP_002951309.1 hypothetical protein VOLCADRAFT_120959 [Volvox carteri f. nagariensis]
MLSSLQANQLTGHSCTRLQPKLPLCKPSLRSGSTASRETSLRRSAQWMVKTRASTQDSSAAADSQTLATDVPSAESTSSSADGKDDEVVFYEGPGSNAELILSLILLPTLIYAPLSIASIGRRLWISFKFTNKRLVITNTSPLFKRTIEIAYKNIKEIRSGPRGFGLWGDMVVFLRDGSRIELTGLEKYKEIEDHINRCIYTL